MSVPGIPHRWDLSPSDAVALQKTLADSLILDQPLKLDEIELIAGVDVSVKENISRAAVVVMTYPGMDVVEAVTARIPTAFPYISGLLTFREGEVILEAHAKLRESPQVYVFDGMGTIHPRGIGIASHMGLWLDKPTIGCGKTPFVGTFNEPGLEKGSYEPISYKGKMIGYVLRSRTKVKPVYISAGHRATHESALTLIMNCVTKYRLPEPVRAAHVTAGDF